MSTGSAKRKKVRAETRGPRKRVGRGGGVALVGGWGGGTGWPRGLVGGGWGWCGGGGRHCPRGRAGTRFARPSPPRPPPPLPLPRLFLPYPPPCSASCRWCSSWHWPASLPPYLRGRAPGGAERRRAAAGDSKFVFLFFLSMSIICGLLAFYQRINVGLCTTPARPLD